MIPTFFQWIEAVVATKDINKAIRESIEFIIGGKWETKSNNFQKFSNFLKTGPVGNKEEVQRCHVSMTSPQATGFFYLNAWTEVKKEIEKYDSKTGNENISIEADLFARMELNPSIVGGFQKIGTGFFKTPYELAKWAKEKIDNYKNDDDGGNSGEWEDAPDPTLSPVLVRR